MNCPVCGGTDARLFFQSKLDWSLRSDVTPLPVSSRVLRCQDCSHLFRQAELTEKWSDYEHYDAFDNSPARDKVDFTARIPASRSRAILAYLGRAGALGRGAQVLDFGCHRGSFLALLTGRGHAGLDVSEQYRPVIEGLDCRYYTPSAPPPREAFDLLTLIHVFEHLSDPAQGIALGLQALKAGGKVLIQVPDIRRHPTDLYVMDHHSHFSPYGIDRAMARAGLRRAARDETVVAGEQTALFERGRGSNAGPRRPAPQAQDKIRAALEEGERRLIEFKASGKPCVVYGTMLLAALVGSVLGDRVTAAVDDDRALWGRRWMGVEVSSLDGLPPGSTVAIAVPPSAARLVAARCREKGHYPRVFFLPAQARTSG